MQGRELLVGNGLGVLVTGNVDVDNAAGVDVRREQDGGKFDLKGYCGQHSSVEGTGYIVLACNAMIRSGIDGGMDANEK